MRSPALEARRCPSGSGLACRPNLAGRLAAEAPFSYLESASARRPSNDPSMLLSFERPASAGPREARPTMVRTTDASHGRRIRLSTVLENCTEATSAAIDKRRLKNGYHRAPNDRIRSARGGRPGWGQITVKIVRAHGGCLGTKSR